ncbi:hypothetical protein [Methylobacter luteus]|uniref:hypothetical protein n=1 Tax=Methylobacter luteus TaxID=415 RepID=UPI00041BA20F|nr:hypothetical protein [Methylobacter luteus]
MGLNLSNAQISRELDLNEADVQPMTRQLRSGMVSKRPAVVLKGEVECMGSPGINASQKP